MIGILTNCMFEATRLPQEKPVRASTAQRFEDDALDIRKGAGGIQHQQGRFRSTLSFEVDHRRLAKPRADDKRPN